MAGRVQSEIEACAGLTGVFAMRAIGGAKGLAEGNPGQVSTQAEGIGATVLYCAAVSFAILKGLDVTMVLRVDEETEVAGLDINLHGETVH